MPGNTLVYQRDQRLIPIIRAAFDSPPPERKAHPSFVTSETEALDAIDRQTFNVAIIDPELDGDPAPEGGGIIERLVALAPDMVVIALCEWDETLVRPVLEPGAHHYLPKDEVTERSLWRAIDAARTIAATQRRLADAAIELEARYNELAVSLATTHELQDMVALLAHDLPAPLRSARVFADRARHDPANWTRWLSRMDASLEEAVELVRSVLMEHRERVG
jgi:signal transduction histidine kinase